MQKRDVSLASGLLCFVMLAGMSQALSMTSSIEAEGPLLAQVRTSNVKLAQVQLTPPAPSQPPAASPANASASDQQAAEEPIGNVATLTGTASVTRNNEAMPLKLKDDIFLNDELQTSANSKLGVTFNDATTFNLTANARITVDSYVYEEGGKANAALFNVTKGTVAFVAAAVAKTGDMKIATPTATLGIRGTSGLVEVPEGASATSRNNVAIKLYPDPDGKVGQIEVNDRAGARLGFLTQGASGFTIRPGTGGARFAAIPLLISPQQMLRDQGFVRQVHAAQNFGRQIVNQRQIQRRQNPGRSGPGRQPGQQRQPGLQNRPGQQQPGLQNRQGLLPQPGSTSQPGQPSRRGQPQQPGLQGPPGQQTRPGLQRPPGQFRPAPPPRRGPVGRPGQRPPPQDRR